MYKSYYKSIVDTLKPVKTPGLYGANEEADIPLPVILLTGEPNTILCLPLCEAQPRHLIELASRAPYRKGKKQLLLIN